MPEDVPAATGQIPTNLRLLLLFEAVAQKGTPISPAELGTALGLPKPTIHRLLQTAEAEGFVQRDLDGRSFGPGRRLRRLAVHTLSSLHVRAARLAILTRVAEEIGETCNIATPDRETMTYLDRVETKWPLRIQLPVGTQVPFHCTASGKMFLSSLKPAYLDKLLAAGPLVARTARSLTDPKALRSELDRVRAEGHATDNEEFMDGMVAVAVPILDDRRRVLATLSVHAPIQRHDLAALRRHLPLLHRSSRALSELLLD